MGAKSLEDSVMGGTVLMGHSVMGGSDAMLELMYRGPMMHWGYADVMGLSFIGDL